MHRRSVLAWLPASAALALMPAAVRAEMAAAITEPVTITYYNYNLGSAGLGKEATVALIDAFMAANPLIRVEAIPVPSNEVLARVQADVVAGLEPDVAQLVFRDLYYIVDSLGAQPLEDLAGPEFAAHTRGMIPRGLELGKVGGRTYGLAYTFSTPVMYYNADLFRAAGLDPDHPPATWPEVRAAALAIVETTGKHGFYPGIYGPTDGTFVYQSIVMSNGGRVREGNRLTFADDGAAEAVLMLRDMADAGAHARIDAAAPADAMASGNLGMFVYTTAVLSRLSKAAQGKFELRIATLPAFPGKPTAPTNSGSALFLFSKDPVRQRAAWELMKFMTSREAYAVITSKIGYLPLRLDIVDDPKLLGEWIKANPMYRVNLEQLSRLTPNIAFPGPDYGQVEEMMRSAVSEAVLGTGDALAVLRDAQTRAQALMPATP